jgi:hypothetical protein
VVVRLCACLGCSHSLATTALRWALKPCLTVCLQLLPIAHYVFHDQLLQPGSGLAELPLGQAGVGPTQR